MLKKKLLVAGLTLAMALSVVPSIPADAAAVTITKSTIGTEDRQQAFWSAFSQAFDIEEGKKVTLEFENHGTDTANYYNFDMILANDAKVANTGDTANPDLVRDSNYFEYVVIRPDLWGWNVNSTHVGTPLAADGVTATAAAGSLAGEQTTSDGKTLGYESTLNWDTFASIIKDSNVKLEIVRSGNVVQINQTITSIADPTQSFTTKNTVSCGNIVDDDNNTQTDKSVIKLVLTVDHAYISNLKADISDVTEEVKVDEVKAADVAQAPETKKTMSFMSASASTTKVTGSMTITGAKVTVSDGKNTTEATVSGKNFTAKLAKSVKPGTKLTITATKDGYNDVTKTVVAKGTLKVSAVKAKKGSKKITGTVSVKKATVKVKVGKKKYKKATVKGKKFTYKTAALKKGTTVKIQVSKTNYKTVTKTVKVKK